MENGKLKLENGRPGNRETGRPRFPKTKKLQAWNTIFNFPVSIFQPCQSPTPAFVA